MTYTVSSGMLNSTIPYHTYIGLSVLDLGLTYGTDRQMSDAHHGLMPPNLGAGA